MREVADASRLRHRSRRGASVRDLRRAIVTSSDAWVVAAPRRAESEVLVSGAPIGQLSFDAAGAGAVLKFSSGKLRAGGARGSRGAHRAVRWRRRLLGRSS